MSTISPAAPTHPATAARPARPAGSSATVGSVAGPAGAATGAGAAPAAGPAQAWKGKTKILPFVVGAGLALALADTRAAPVVIAVLVGAVIFQVMNL